MVQGRSMRIDTAEGAAFVFAIFHDRLDVGTCVIRPPKSRRRSPEAAIHGRTVQMKHGFVERRAASVL
jgi:hypothetical protein